MRRPALISVSLSLLLAACAGEDGENGLQGPPGPQGEQGPQGPAGGFEPTETPQGLGTTIWNPAVLEDRSTDPATPTGSVTLLRDDLGQYFLWFDDAFTRQGVESLEVYSAVSGSALDSQMANFDDSEKPFQIGTISKDGGQYLRLDAAPPQASGGQKRFFDWVILWNPATNSNAAAADMDARNDIPVGVLTQVWDSFELEDRRTSPAKAGFGTASMVRDDRGVYYIAFDSSFVMPEGFSSLPVYQAVSGSGLKSQQDGFDPSERPFPVATISSSGAQFIRLDGAPKRAAGGNQRFFDWVILYDETNEVNVAVADLDADNDIPNGVPELIWNPAELEDRRGAQPESGFGSASIVRDDRDTYFIMLTDDFVRPDDADADAYLAVNSANIGDAMVDLDPSERPIKIGTVTADGLQFIRLKVELDRAIGGEKRFHDWLILYNGTDNVAVADFDALNEIVDAPAP